MQDIATPVDSWCRLREDSRSIVTVSRRKTAAIDALIAKKERLIELLQEKRQALITQAVTKGLDPNVPMKDSGVEWLGRRPRALGAALAQAPWSDPSRNSPREAIVAGKATSIRPYLRVANVHEWLAGSRGHCKLSRFHGTRLTGYALHSGDVLMNQRGDFENWSMATYSARPQICDCILRDHVFAVRPWRGVNPYRAEPCVVRRATSDHFFMLRSNRAPDVASMLIDKPRCGADLRCPRAGAVEAIVAAIAAAHLQRT